MAKCEKCGDTYYSKECGNCKRLEYEENLSSNNKTSPEKYEESLRNKTINKEAKKASINIPLIVIAVSLSIVSLIMIKNEYHEYKANQMINQILFGTDDSDEIEKETDKMIKEAHKSMKQMNETLKKTNDMFYKNMENINKNFKINNDKETQ
jgi:hypothetical protein